MSFMFKNEIGFISQSKIDEISAIQEFELRKSEIGVECSATITLTAENGSIDFVLLEQFDIIGYKYIFLCDNITKQYLEFCKIPDYIFEKHKSHDILIRMLAMKLMLEGSFFIE